MLTISADQMDRIAKQAFYSRLARFVAARGLSSALREAAANTSRTYALWDEYWAVASALSEHDAALRLVFVLAWSLDRSDVAKALDLLQQNEISELLMKRALSERGHMRFSDFDHSASSEASE